MECLKIFANICWERLRWCSTLQAETLQWRHRITFGLYVSTLCMNEFTSDKLMWIGAKRRHKYTQTNYDQTIPRCVCIVFAQNDSQRETHCEEYKNNNQCVNFTVGVQLVLSLQRFYCGLHMQRQPSSKYRCEYWRFRKEAKRSLYPYAYQFTYNELNYLRQRLY